MVPCPPDSVPRPWEQRPPSSEAVEMQGLHLLSAFILSRVNKKTGIFVGSRCSEVYAEGHNAIRVLRQ